MLPVSQLHLPEGAVIVGWNNSTNAIAQVPMANAIQAFLASDLSSTWLLRKYDVIEIF